MQCTVLEFAVILRTLNQYLIAYVIRKTVHEVYYPAKLMPYTRVFSGSICYGTFHRLELGIEQHVRTLLNCRAARLCAAARRGECSAESRDTRTKSFSCVRWRGTILSSSRPSVWDRARCGASIFLIFSLSKRASTLNEFDRATTAKQKFV